MSDKATSRVFDRTDLLTKLDAAEKALVGEKEETEKQRRGSEWAHALLQERSAQWSVDYLGLSQKLAGEKARVDIAERRSIAAGEQAEALQAQVIDLKAALRKATGRIEKLEALRAAIVEECSNGCEGPCEHGPCNVELECEECHLDRDQWCVRCTMATAIKEADDASK